MSASARARFQHPIFWIIVLHSFSGRFSSRLFFNSWDHVISNLQSNVFAVCLVDSYPVVSPGRSGSSNGRLYPRLQCLRKPTIFEYNDTPFLAVAASFLSSIIWFILKFCVCHAALSLGHIINYRTLSSPPKEAFREERVENMNSLRVTLSTFNAIDSFWTFTHRQNIAPKRLWVSSRVFSSEILLF